VNNSFSSFKVNMPFEADKKRRGVSNQKIKF